MATPRINAAPKMAPVSELMNQKTRSSKVPQRDNMASAGPSTGTKKLNSSPRTMPGLVSTSGSSLVSASVKISPISRNENTQYLMARGIEPAETRYENAKNSPVSSSNTTYGGEIGR